jgi:uncharacterized protein DUF6915
MNPYDHALSSVRHYRGRAEDYQPLHNWFDASKATLAHFTHRALRHHREGSAKNVSGLAPAGPDWIDNIFHLCNG